MREKKHIDRLFQEKFKNLEVTPSEDVWKQIEARLEKKKKRRVVPIWWRYAGIAATLVLLVVIGNQFLGNSSKIPEIQTVDTNTNSESSSSTNSIDDTIPSLNNNVVKEKGDYNDDKSLVNPYIKQEVVEQNPNNLNESSQQLQSVNNNRSNTDIAIKTNTKKTNSNNTSTSNSSIANVNPKEDTEITKTLEETTDIAENIIKNDSSVNADSLQFNTVKDKLNTQSIEDAIADNDNIIEKEKQDNRWSISPNIAPVYYNVIGSGSHIDDQFVGTSKSGELNTSYGINVAYALSNRLKIRSGVSNVKLSYDTDNVILFEGVGISSLARNSLKNVNLTNNSQSINALSANNFQVQEAIGILPNENAAISQRINYMEVPIELEYNLLKNNFGLNLIGGFSTFFLSNNEVFSEYSGRKTYIGEANNINSLSFSANLGIGFDYKFSEKFKFNLEPTFKYQLNAFENTFGKFNPYIFGVYTGFSFRF